MKKADYSRIASYYDDGRILSDQNIRLWLDLISEFSSIPQGGKLLDLGCGTGRFSIPIADRLGFEVVGADFSLEMLAKARKKHRGNRVAWTVQDACSLTFPDHTFDGIFMSHLLHHVDNPLKALAECHRLLIYKGVVLIRYGAMDQIKGDVEHALFPEVIELDESRTPTTAITEHWLSEIGFEGIYSKEILQQTYETAQARLNAARLKSTSVLSMISEESFKSGLVRLADYVETNPEDEWLLFDKMTLTVGFKKGTMG